MGRGRAKGKKLSGSNQDDTGSGEEEKIPTQKRRGRPQKSLKDEIDEDEVAKIEDEDEVAKIEDEDSEDTTCLPPHKDAKFKAATPNGKKRKKNAQVEEEKVELAKEENGNGTKPSTEESNKSNGFRQTSSRRKSKPRRAAEAVVECN